MAILNYRQKTIDQTLGKTLRSKFNGRCNRQIVCQLRPGPKYHHGINNHHVHLKKRISLLRCANKSNKCKQKDPLVGRTI